MNYLKYVNIKMGTDSVPRFSKGNTLPLVARPFGMISFCPQTEILKEQFQWFFNPTRPYLDGVRLTHQASPWIGDYGTVLLTPQSDFISDNYKSAGSSYKIERAEMAPHYMGIYFNRSLCKMELTPTKRCGKIRLSFDTDKEKCLSVFNVHGQSEIKLDKKRGILFVANNYNEKGDVTNFKAYIAIKVLSGLDKEKSRGDNNAYHLFFSKNQVEITVAISYISFQMALDTMDLECKKRSFNTLLKEGEREWNDCLSRLTPSLGSKRERQIFYSCLYRAFLFPRVAHEITKDGESVYFAPKSGEVRSGTRYTDHGAWDTYRTLFPLFTLIAREEYEDILKGMLSDYEDCGYLPRWSSFGEVGCMPSTLVDGIIAEAVSAGIGSPELHKRLLGAMIHHAENESSDKRYGRNGIEAYKKYGYVPCDMERESVNLTLDFAYGDWCIHRVAQIVGDSEVSKKYEARSRSYLNLFDKETGYIRPKYSNGEFKEPFDPYMWGGDFTESGADQCLFGAPHALAKIGELLGGYDKALLRLDRILKENPPYRVRNYGGEIHEMSEMANSDLGGIAISNQPSFSLPYLFAFYGSPEKTKDVVKEIIERLFTPDAYPGDEDTGSMSAWYILSTIKKFPLCPGSGKMLEI